MIAEILCENVLFIPRKATPMKSHSRNRYSISHWPLLGQYEISGVEFKSRESKKKIVSATESKSTCCNISTGEFLRRHILYFASLAYDFAYRKHHAKYELTSDI